MKITIEQIIKDFLALRGESPDLLPLLDEGDESAVLTLERAIKARLIPAAIEATLAIPPLLQEEIKSLSVTPLADSGGVFILRMPDDYLKLHTLRMGDWKEPVREPEPEGTLRSDLGANAPQWMICEERPMVKEIRDNVGISLYVYGSRNGSPPPVLLYVSVPKAEDGTLTISRAAYHRMLDLLKDT